MADKEKKKKKKKGGRSNWRIQVLMIIIVMAALAAMPTSLMMLIGMMPTFGAFLIDRTSEKIRVLTVGAMNVSGCTPFVLRLWTSGHTMENSLSIITDPRTIIVMYCAAGIGYVIDWTVSGLVATIMVGRAASRREQIAKQQASMAERWGREVTGEILVDSMGFPLESEEDEENENKEKKPAAK
ncbi:MAG TPA: hypothetical protein VIF12_06140 [Micavibrio sp.]|jgi:hypothetical protein